MTELRKALIGNGTTLGQRLARRCGLVHATPLEASACLRCAYLALAPISLVSPDGRGAPVQASQATPRRIAAAKTASGNARAAGEAEA